MTTTHRHKTSFLSIAITIIIVAAPACSEARDRPIRFPKKVHSREAPLPTPDSEINPDMISFFLYDPHKDRVVAAHNEDKSLYPASASKLAMAASSLYTLGADYRFPTWVAMHGDLEDNGVLQGDLLVRGSGNPHFGVRDIYRIAHRLKEMGLKRVTGKVYFDQSYFGHGQSINELFADDGKYNAGYSALSFDKNIITLKWDTTGSGRNEKLNVEVLPQVNSFKTEISYTRKRRYILFVHDFWDKGEKWKLVVPRFRRHGIPRYREKGHKKMPIKKPAIFTAYLFSKILRKHGIELAEPRPLPQKLKGDSWEVLLTHQGRPLDQMLKGIVHYSNNVGAELVWLHTARKLQGEPIQHRETGQILSRYISQSVPGVNWQDFYLSHGSGLSTESRATAKQMTAIVLWGSRYSDKSNYDFYNLMPISGWEYPFVKRYNGDSIRYRMRGKTGTLFYGISLAGVFLSKGGKWWPFTIMISDLDRRRRLDRMYRSNQIQRGTIAHGKEWVQRAKDVVSNILLYWGENY